MAFGRWLPAIVFAVGMLFGAASAQERPNVVVILIDDVGFMDLGAFGGEAKTPTIDALAARGTMFTRAHTSPLCAPSRAMLLTGIDSHRAGVSSIPEVLPPELIGKPGYGLSLEPGVETIATHLRASGYRTFMTGKWHLGSKAGELPIDHGFDRSFALDASGADNWEDKSYMPFYDEAPWFEDEEEADLPDDFYSSEFIVDKMIDYLDSDDRDQQPFFAYLAFQAIHIPVQAPREYTEQYLDTYALGWDHLREQRFTRAKTMGLIPQDAALGPMHESIDRWDDLNAEEKAFRTKSMAVNAGMLAAMDDHLGRFIDYLQSTNHFDNTIFVITSDNGPEYNDPLKARGMGTWLRLNGYNWDTETLGEKGSYGFIGPAWASAAASPSARFKFYQSEGGTRVPLVITGPGLSRAMRSAAFTYVTDITPTLLDLTASTPVDGVAITGRSLGPILRGESEVAYGPDEPVGMEMAGHSALIRGQYKLLRDGRPYSDNVWRLFDIIADPGETNDLAAKMPELFESMMTDYQAYTEEFSILALPEGYSTAKQLNANGIRNSIKTYGPMLLGLLLMVIAIIGGSIYFLIKRIRMRRV
ncbi:MAG: arylsulfatase [Pseudomonadota bacterium]